MPQLPEIDWSVIQEEALKQERIQEQREEQERRRDELLERLTLAVEAIANAINPDWWAER